MDAAYGLFRRWVNLDFARVQVCKANVHTRTQLHDVEMLMLGRALTQLVVRQKGELLKPTCMHVMNELHLSAA